MVLSSDLHVIKIKINYLQNFMRECKRSCRQCMEKYPKTEDSYYVLACCLVKEKKFQEAYDIMNEMMTAIDVPTPNAYRLNGQICSALETPPLAEANFSANSAYEASPDDMDTLLQRACSYAMSRIGKMLRGTFPQFYTINPTSPMYCASEPEFTHVNGSGRRPARTTIQSLDGIQRTRRL